MWNWGSVVLVLEKIGDQIKIEDEKNECPPKGLFKNTIHQSLWIYDNGTQFVQFPISL